MQTVYKSKAVHKTNFSPSLDQQPISAYMGRQIFLSRVVTQSSDKGLWLHWYHPQDQGQKGALKCGRFISPEETLEDALHAVHQLIEATIELEMSGDARFDFHPAAYPVGDDTGGYLGGHLPKLDTAPTH